MNAGYAMRLREPGAALIEEPITPVALTEHQVRLQVLACGVCRTDLHLVDGELPQAHYPITPGHEIVGRVIERGMGVTELAVEIASAYRGSQVVAASAPIVDVAWRTSATTPHLQDVRWMAVTRRRPLLTHAFAYPFPHAIAIRRRRRYCAPG